MSMCNILIFAALLLSFMITASVARPYSTLQSNDTETEKKCETNECLIKSTLDAHLDYIYTQSPPPKLHTVVKEIGTLCETEECLMKATSSAHLDYIYTQKSPPQH
ncbi:unnamed protein product [Brassica oleracea var. botrytis]|uniref:Phytosulfokine n=2 Tax=Brassica TaxID=3705 RepID=A0A816UWN2_BRANA|nr:uncharacterized protein LOC106414850 [Brassica napus]CAF2114151.1 unnamed protein product [Brassica napus]VDD58359.1 unnamed protein product [Brassica oleracea]